MLEHGDIYKKDLISAKSNLCLQIIDPKLAINVLPAAKPQDKSYVM